MQDAMRRPFRWECYIGQSHDTARLGRYPLTTSSSASQVVCLRTQSCILQCRFWILSARYTTLSHRGTAQDANPTLPNGTGPRACKLREAARVQRVQERAALHLRSPRTMSLPAAQTNELL